MTELVFLLDNSGSMHGLEQDTIGGFNSMIEKQKKEPGETLVSVVTFNHSTRVIYDRVPLEQIPPMTDRDYRTGGSTALLDALGGAMKHIRSLHKSMPEETRPEKTVFVITTDGMENASRNYTRDQVRQKIEKHQKKHGWEFIFMGANMDAVQEAARYGIDERHSVTYAADAKGTALNYDVLDEAISELRAGRKLNENWKSRIERDVKERKKRN